MSKLGRDLSKMIIIDNVAENFQFQQANGIHIKNFEGDEYDTELVDITLDLISVANQKVDDVRKYVPKIRHGMIIRNEIAQNKNNFEVVEASERNDTVESNIPITNEVQISEDDNN